MRGCGSVEHYGYDWITSFNCVFLVFGMIIFPSKKGKMDATWQNQGMHQPLTISSLICIFTPYLSYVKETYPYKSHRWSSPHDWLLVTHGQGEKPADDWKVEKRNIVAFIPWHLAPLSLVAAVSLSVIAPARLWSIFFLPHLLRNIASYCCSSVCHTMPCLSCPVCLPTKVFCLRHLN